MAKAAGKRDEKKNQRIEKRKKLKEREIKAKGGKWDLRAYNRDKNGKKERNAKAERDE